MAEDSKPRSDKKKKIIDVAKPGESAPSDNSKSVIVPKRSILKDPMMLDSNDPSPGKDVTNDTPSGNLELKPTGDSAKQTAESDKKSAEALDIPLPDIAKKSDETIDKPGSPASTETGTKDSKNDEVADKKTIADLAKEASAKESTANSETAKKPDTNKEDENATADKDSSRSDEPTATQSDKTEADSGTRTDDEANDADKKKPSQSDAEIAAAEEAETKRQAHLQKLVDDKKYFLPINSIEKRRSKRFIVGGILLSLLLVLAWADVAVDAGIIRIPGVKPVTHFFSN